MKSGSVINKALLISIVLTSLTAVVWAVQHSFKTSVAVTKISAVKEDVKKKIVYDKQLLNKLSEISNASEKGKTDRLIKGTLINRSGSGADLTRQDIVFCIKDSSLYYRVGQTEVINDKGIYLFIDHAAKQVALSKQKKIQMNGIVPAIKDITKRLQDEEYELKGQVSGTLQTLTMINETHVTCKQFSITYDTASLTVKHTMARYTDIADPTNRAKEKIVEVDISVSKPVTDRSDILNPQSVVKRSGDGWQLTEKFADYRLVLL